MELEVLPDAESVARRGATWIAAEARQAVAQRGRFCLAVSGGTTPWKMLRHLAVEELPWERVHVFQVDERVAADGDPERNLTHLRQCLLEHSPLPADQLYPMPVEAPDLDAAAACYTRALAHVVGAPPVVDIAHLGLGTDGHTASLVPGDPVVEVQDVDVSNTVGAYQGRRRMTVTYPFLARARHILWLVTGSAKAEMLRRLCDADASIPAGRVFQGRALLLADRAAAGRARVTRTSSPIGEKHTGR